MYMSQPITPADEAANKVEEQPPAPEPIQTQTTPTTTMVSKEQQQALDDLAIERTISGYLLQIMALRHNQIVNRS